MLKLRDNKTAIPRCAHCSEELGYDVSNYTEPAAQSLWITKCKRCQGNIDLEFKIMESIVDDWRKKFQMTQIEAVEALVERLKKELACA